MTSLRACLMAALLGAIASDAQGQSLTNGALRVRVVDQSDVTLAGTDVTVVEVGSGATRTFHVNRSGQFTIALAPVGEYEVSGELLGYQPQRVTGIPVRAGQTATVTLRLAPAQFPVRDVRTVPFEQSATDVSMAGVRLAFPSFLLRNPPTDQRDLAGLITGIVGPDHLAAQGLPSSSTGVLIDGMIVNGARYSPSPARGERAAGLNLDALRSVAMVSNDIDVEVTGYAGALVRVESRRGTRASGRSAHGLFGNSRMSSSAGFRGGPPDYTSATGGLSLSGPIIADTAHYVFSFQAQQLERPLPRIWELDDAVDARAVEAAREAFDLDLASYTRPNTVRTDILSAFGRVDWRIAGAHHVDVRASVSGLPRILAPRDATLPGAASGSDVWIAAMATSQLMSGLGHELRITGERTLREGAYGLGAWAPTNLDLPSTHIVEGPLDFGPQSGDIDRFQRAGLTASQTVFLQTARHRLKVGTTFGLASYDFTHDPVRAGESFFGSVDAFARHDGLAIVGSGPLRVGRLTQAEYGVYAQDSWSPASDLEVIVGARYDVIRAPSRNARLNERWAQLSDLTTTGLPRTRNSVSPRFALYWRPGPPGRTTFQVSGGVFREPHDPGILADALIQDGSAQIRRSLGTLERWPSPTVSNTNAASLLTLLTPDFAAPRTVRATIGLSHLLRDNLAVHLSGTARQTRLLPRRIDLNLHANPVGEDQYGRALYGRLVQQAQLLVAAPGSNRRFPSFDVVTAWAASGTSDYWDVTAALERRSTGPVQWFASYTYGRARDDWQAKRDVATGLFPPLLSAQTAGATWLDARSEFDVPHRLTLASEFKLPTALGPRVTAIYRFRSGPVFTPGFRGGVDANGDGSPYNDPAFIDGELEGLDDLRREWDCLRLQIGRFAERNSCRAPGLHSLDAHLAWRVARVAGAETELLVEGLNLFDTQFSIPDRALVLVDAARTLESNPGGTTRVPLLINPHFGKPLLRSSSGRALRVGLRLSH